jgi:hypothetical protein
MKVVGPAKRTTIISTIASTMLMLDRILIPLSTPVDADSRKAMVITTRMPVLTVRESGSTPKTSARPE